MLNLMRIDVTPIVVTSFGYRHAPAPPATLTYDLRELLHDPLQLPELSDLTGLDDRVAEHIMRINGSLNLVSATAVTVHQLVTDTRRPVHVAFGCTSGRNKAVVLARTLAGTLKLRGHQVDVQHRDVHQPLHLAVGAS